MVEYWARNASRIKEGETKTDNFSRNLLELDLLVTICCRESRLTRVSICLHICVHILTGPKVVT